MKANFDCQLGTGPLKMVGPRRLAQGTTQACSRRSKGGQANEKVDESRDEQLAECSFCTLFTSLPPDARGHSHGTFCLNRGTFRDKRFCSKDSFSLMSISGQVLRFVRLFKHKH